MKNSFNGSKYPRTLIITQAVFNNITGTGVLLTNLFDGWPKDKLAMIHFDDWNPLNYNNDICSMYYGLSSAEKRFVWPLSVIKKNIIKNNSSQKKVFENTDHKNKYKLLVRILGGEEVIKKLIVSKDVIKWVKPFRPDVIYCHVSSLNHIRYILNIYQRLKIPIVFHVMDDILFSKHGNGILSFFIKYMFQSKFKQLIDISAARLGIGDMMCETYINIFKTEFLPFSNPVDCNYWNCITEENSIDQFTIVYAGTINNKNLVLLKQASEIIEKLYNADYNIKLTIYSFKSRADHYRKELSKNRCVDVLEVPDSNDQLKQAFSTARLLFLPVDFTKESTNRMKLSIFAKLPLYLSTGVPILYMGPTGIASYDLLKKNEAAHFVTENKKDLLETKLDQLYYDSDLLHMPVASALNLARDQFEKSKVRSDFLDVLRTSAKVL